MAEKKYVLMEVAEENGCNLENLKYDGIYCSLTDEICPMSEDKPCPHGKTLEELVDVAANFPSVYTTKYQIKEVIKALLGEGGEVK